MQIEMTIVDGDADYTRRLHETRRIWSGDLICPVSPMAIDVPEGASSEERLEAFAEAGMPTAGILELGPDGDVEAARGGFGMDDLIMEASSAELLIDYPLDRPAHLNVTGIRDGKLTPQGIIDLVKTAYQEIYRLEDGGKEIPVSQQGKDGITLMNRPATNGMFGIWGHGIHDLVIEEISVGDAGQGHCMLRVLIGS